MHRGRIVVALATIATGLLVPSGASAHAYLIKTVPAASGVLDAPPPDAQLTFDEAVEPRFAIVSVTNAAGTQETTGPVRRSPANPDTLIAPLRAHLPAGWYLIYWRAISVDGHPVQGAFTYAVGPNPGPAPQFPVPSIGASATSPPLLIARWVMFLSVMSAIGLFVLRLLIARVAVRRTPGMSLRAISRAFLISSVLGVLAIPVYLDFATANDSVRSAFDLGALVPLFRVTPFGRGYLDMALCFALFCLAGWIALWLDRPERELRSLAELTASCGALLAAAAVLLNRGHLSLRRRPTADSGRAHGSPGQRGWRAGRHRRDADRRRSRLRPDRCSPSVSSPARWIPALRCRCWYRRIGRMRPWFAGGMVERSRSAAMPWQRPTPCSRACPVTFGWRRQTPHDCSASALPRLC
jgi:methionine-rich copper-binding protein CopC